ncbi:hypothetical protein LQQ63_26410 (plasmid) [Escherichia coli]|nr:hypothetical protein LQQ63_26410 [Escherichia coli]
MAAPADFFNPKKHNSHGMAKNDIKTISMRIALAASPFSLIEAARDELTELAQMAGINWSACSDNIQPTLAGC